MTTDKQKRSILQSILDYLRDIRGIKVSHVAVTVLTLLVGVVALPQCQAMLFEGPRDRVVKLGYSWNVDQFKSALGAEDGEAVEAFASGGIMIEAALAAQIMIGRESLMGHWERPYSDGVVEGMIQATNIVGDPCPYLFSYSANETNIQALHWIEKVKAGGLYKRYFDRLCPNGSEDLSTIFSAKQSSYFSMKSEMSGHIERGFCSDNPDRGWVCQGLYAEYARGLNSIRNEVLLFQALDQTIGSESAALSNVKTWLVGTWAFQADGCVDGMTTWGIIFDSDGSYFQSEGNGSQEWSSKSNQITLTNFAGDGSVSSWTVLRRGREKMTFLSSDLDEPYTLYRCA